MGFYLIENQVWVKLETLSAVPLESLGTSSSPVVQTNDNVKQVEYTENNPQTKTDIAPEIKIEKTESEIKILAVFRDRVKLNVGSKDGIADGNQFDVFREETIKSEMGKTVKADVKIATIEIKAIGVDYSLAVIPRGVVVHKSDSVKKSTKNKRIFSVYPEKLSNIAEVSFVIRPMISLSSGGGFGSMVEGTATYTGEHYFINLRLQPISIGRDNSNTMANGSMFVEGGYDSRAFGVGLGIGAGFTNAGLNQIINNFYYDGYGDSTQTGPEDSNVGFALSQAVRLGARDGLNLTVYNNFIYIGSEHNGFYYGGTIGKISIPLNLKVNLFLYGGGGPIGYGFGEIGVSTWVLGNGGPGSVAITGALGWAGMWKYTDDYYSEDGYYYDETVSVTGPTASLGFVYRFGKK
ncbi:MAG: hypothetical protein JXR91_04110 [Deltaproteobacteria bacterium]|nr:hypothetical protein [Deltaproteobacteria bacterium]